jgi:hypothetical protein
MEKSTRNILIGVAVLVVGVGSVIAYKKTRSGSSEGKGGKKGGKDAPDAKDTQTKSAIGKKVKIHPELGYSNVRSTPIVDDGKVGSWFGYRLGGNFIKKAESNPIGTVQKAVTGSDGYIWYEVNLASPVDGKTMGWVREDAVTF